MTNKITISTRLNQLRHLMQENHIDGYFLPHEDELLSEYLPKYTERLHWLTNFSGSAGLTFIGAKKAIIFVDGRYTTQVKNQTDKKLFESEHLINPGFINWIKKNPYKNKKIGLDPKTISQSNYLSLKKICKETCIDLIETDNLIDKIWKRKKKKKNLVERHELKYSGLDSEKKIRKIINSFKNNAADSIFISQPENVCWTLNIRGKDLEHTPILRSHLILDKHRNIALFTDNMSEKSKIQSWLGKKIKILKTKQIKQYLEQNNYKKIQYDPVYTTRHNAKLLEENSVTSFETNDPTTLMKACKNKIEIAGARKAHLIDGIALTKFIYWLENEINSISKSKCTELGLANKLLSYRKNNSNFKGLSFGTISSLGSNGAIIHYQPKKETNKNWHENDIYLLDSGGQYKYGTTDVTRTILNIKRKRKNKHKEISTNYTLVLKGHIAVASAHFNYGETGKKLDLLARQYLKKHGLNYDHGTGHGVGSYLGVHEGPQNISPRSREPLQEGMIISNEPGYYKPNDYGIRIENLVTVVKSMEKGKDLCLETLTLAPITKLLINMDIMTKKEIMWINNYHKNVYNKLSPFMNKKERNWLKIATEAIDPFHYHLRH